MIHFIYIGRLEYEKGIDLLLTVFPILRAEGVTNRHLSIFGEGTYSHQCKLLARNFPEHFSFHGRQAQEVVWAALQQADYCLMPSRVLESFGLAAFEALLQGVSVIGFKKGGIAPFVHDSLAIEKYEGADDAEKLGTLLKNILSGNIAEIPAERKNEIISHYTLNSRSEKFLSFMNGRKSILLVSDFISKIGGIEAQVLSIKAQAENLGVENWLFGRKIKGNHTLKRKIALFATGFNMRSAIKFGALIRKTKPDVIWFHSITRYLGRLPVWVAAHKGKTIWYKIHDLGIVHPYGARVEHLSQVPEFSLNGRTSLSSNPLKKIFIALKFRNVSACIHILKKNAELFCVPSEFMKNIVAEKLQIDPNRIHVIHNIVLK